MILRSAAADGMYIILRQLCDPTYAGPDPPTQQDMVDAIAAYEVFYEINHENDNCPQHKAKPAVPSAVQTPDPWDKLTGQIPPVNNVPTVEVMMCAHADDDIDSGWDVRAARLLEQSAHEIANLKAQLADAMTRSPHNYVPKAMFDQLRADLARVMAERDEQFRLCQQAHVGRIAASAELAEALARVGTKEDAALANRMVDAAKTELAEAKRYEGVCHCGTLLSQHSLADEHMAVEMQPRCPFEQELTEVKALLLDAPCTCTEPDGLGLVTHDPLNRGCYRVRVIVAAGGGVNPSDQRADQGVQHGK